MRLNTYITYKKEYDENKQRDLIFYVNALNTIDLWCYDEDDTVVDISGATVTLIVQNKVNLATGENPDLNIIGNLIAPTSGNAEIEITKSDCVNLEGNYIYEIKIALVETGHDYVLAQGNCTFKKTLN